MAYQQLPSLSQSLYALANERQGHEGRLRELEGQRNQNAYQVQQLAQSQVDQTATLNRAQEEWWVREQQRLDNGFQYV